MREALVTCLAALACSALLHAGPVYGAVFLNDAAVRGAAITVVCGGAVIRGVTLDDGSYRLNAPEGRCTFTVSSPSFGTASAEVSSSGSAARYVFDVVKGGGGYELRRR